VQISWQNGETNLSLKAVKATNASQSILQFQVVAFMNHHDRMNAQTNDMTNKAAKFDGSTLMAPTSRFNLGCWNHVMSRPMVQGKQNSPCTKSQELGLAKVKTH